MDYNILETKQVKEIILLHGKWLRGELGGVRADLRSADLRFADLRSADLSFADLPSPTIFLLANWGEVSDLLTTELMKYDASNHPQPNLFAAWASGGDCPYNSIKWQRCAIFQEKKELWKPGKCKMSALQLVEALFKEKKIKR